MQVYWAPTSIPAFHLSPILRTMSRCADRKPRAARGTHPRSAGLSVVPAYLLDSPEAEPSPPPSSLYLTGGKVLGHLTCFVLGFLASPTSSQKETGPCHHLRFHLLQTCVSVRLSHTPKVTALGSASGGGRIAAFGDVGVTAGFPGR